MDKSKIPAILYSQKDKETYDVPVNFRVSQSMLDRIHAYDDGERKISRSEFCRMAIENFLQYLAKKTK
jgi:hypothetical protein